MGVVSVALVYFGIVAVLDAAKRRKHGITRDRVVDAAIELVEREGPEALSMRRLASYLGLKPMSFYSHISSRDELLDEMTSRVLEDVKVPPIEGRRARDVIYEGYVCYFDAMSARPGVTALTTRRPIRSDSKVWLQLVDLRHRLLMDMGLTETQAVDAGRSLAVYIAGAALNAANYSTRISSAPTGWV